MDKFPLKLFILGNTPLSRRAIKNLNALWENPETHDLFTIEIIDLNEHPERAEKEKILATPLLLIKEPPVQRRIIGDLSNHEKVLEAMGLDKLNYNEP